MLLQPLYGMIITDFENYEKWNPFIREISGVNKEGSYNSSIYKTTKFQWNEI